MKDNHTVKADVEYVPVILCGCLVNLMGLCAFITADAKMAWWTPEITGGRARAFGVIALAWGVCALIIGIRRWTTRRG